MRKSILITYGDQKWTQQIATFCLEEGHQVNLHFECQSKATAFQEMLPTEFADSLSVLVDGEMSSESVEAMVSCIIGQQGSIDVLIHGNEMLDENALFESDPTRLGEEVNKFMTRIFRINKSVVAHMVKRKAGSIIYPLLYDALYYAGYPSSPILNHGKISLMKSMSRESSAFKLAVNTMTFGYYDHQFDREQKKEKRKTLEIFGLKAPLLSLKEMIPALRFLIDPPVKNMGGQNYHISTGIETVL